MRLVRYGGAMSLDGYIAGPNGEHDWIVMDPEMDFAAMTAAFDTYLIGRKTYEVMTRMGNAGAAVRGIQNVICSRSMDPAKYPGVTISTDAVRTVTELKAAPGKDIALFGGGELFRSLLAAGLVDRVEVSLIPVLLGAGVQLLPAPASRASLKLRSERLYKNTGTVALEYEIIPARSSARRPTR